MKKIISLLTIAVMMMAFAVPALGMGLEFVSASDKFSLYTYKAPKATGTVNVDAASAVEDAYDKNDDSYINVAAFSEYAEGVSKTTGATADAYVAWDEDYLYVHINVKDSTPISDDSTYHDDSIEFYVDYDNKKESNGQKVKYNAYTNKSNDKNTYAAQFRVLRAYRKNDDIYSSGPQNSTAYNAMRKVADNTKVAVKDNNKSGYVVELAIPLKVDGKYLPTGNKIGFTLQINDDQNGSSRDSAAYTRDGLQNFAYEYTHFFDDVELVGGSGLSWATRTIQTYIAKPGSSSGSGSGSGSGTTSTPTVKPSTSSTAGTTTPTTSSTVSTAPTTSSTVSTAPSSEAPVSSVENEEPAIDEDTATDTEGNKDGTNANADANGEEGGMSIGLIIGLIAAAVVLLGGAAAAVVIILKKKKAAPTDAE